MCRVAPVLIAAALCATPLLAQDSVIQRMQRRADSLLRSWHEVERLADVADSLEHVRATAGSDTIAVGSLRIIANRSPLPLREAAARAWPAIDSLYGSVAADLAEHPYIFRAVDPDTNVRRDPLHVGLEVPWDLDVAATVSLLLRTVEAPRFDRALGDWLGTVLQPAAGSRADGGAVFLQLVTAPSTAVRNCFLGELARCEDVLQVRDTTGLLERWYATPAEREALVTGSFAYYFGRGGTAALLQRCRQHHDDACTDLLRSLPLGTVPRPLSAEARLLLLREALRAGGRDAYPRLVASPEAPIGVRLASASGMTLDSLVIRWRGSILAARPAPLAMPWWAGVAAMSWTAIFGACALRSSRWRL